MRGFARLAVVMAALVAITVVLWPLLPQERLIIWGLAVLAFTYLRLAQPRGKGVPTVLFLVALALALLTALFLTPAGITTGAHEFGLWGVTIALAWWDRSRF